MMLHTVCVLVLFSGSGVHSIVSGTHEMQYLFISVYLCSGFALATILGYAVLFVTVLTLDEINSFQ